jgi:DNA-binding GntR family transcriptional regulator
MIFNGELREGEPVRQEALSERLQVSRVPVREALVQLEAEGLLTYTPHRGAVVARLSLEEIRELYELRALLEVDVFRRAIPRMTDLDIARAKRVLDSFELAFADDDVGQWGTLNWEFHAALYLPARRTRSMVLIQNLHRQTDRYSRLQLVMTKGSAQAEREHSQLLKLSSKGDVRAACDLLKKHILGAGDRLVKFLSAQRAQTDGDPKRKGKENP